MARRGNPRSRVRGRVASIVRVKPQLPPAKGPITRVRFISLRSEGVQSNGDLFVRDGRVVADPPDNLALQNILSEPVWIPEGDGWMLIYADLQPKEFLKALATYHGHGSYYWCEAVAGTTTHRRAER